MVTQFESTNVLDRQQPAASSSDQLSVVLDPPTGWSRRRVVLAVSGAALVGLVAGGAAGALAFTRQSSSAQAPTSASFTAPVDDSAESVHGTQGNLVTGSGVRLVAPGAPRVDDVDEMAHGWSGDVRTGGGRRITATGPAVFFITGRSSLGSSLASKLAAVGY